MSKVRVGIRVSVRIRDSDRLGIGLPVPDVE